MFTSNPFTTRWFIMTVITWGIILVLDELAYYWWKTYHPDSAFSGVLAKHAIQNSPPPTAGTQPPYVYGQ